LIQLTRNKDTVFKTEKHLRAQQIRNFISRLFLSDTSENEKAFESLCLYFHDDDIVLIYDQLTHHRGMEGVYWLVRYLVATQCPLGFEKLFCLLESDYETVREVAISGIKKLSVEIQAKFLIPKLHSAKKEAVYFAIFQLGELKIQSAVKFLLSFLKESRDERIQAVILEALAKIKDSRAFEPIEQMTYSAHAKVSQAALLAMGPFASLQTLRVIKRCIVSDNIQVRKIAYLAALRSGQEKMENTIVQGLTQETDEQLKKDIFVGVRAIKSYPLFAKILNTAIEAPDVAIRRMAQSVLRRAKSPQLLRWIRQELHKREGRSQELLLRLLSDYNQVALVQREFKEILTDFCINNRNSGSQYLDVCSPPNCPISCTNVNNSNQGHISKLIALDALSRADSSETRQFLIEIIKQNNSFSYAAAISLSHILGRDPWPVVGNMLSLDIKEMAPIIQVFLNFLLCLPEGVIIPAEIEDHVKRLKSAENSAIRYLAVKCYIRTSQKTKLEDYFRIVTTDSEGDVRKVAFQEMVCLLNEEPRGLITILFLGLRKMISFATMSRIFKVVYARDKENLEFILNSLLDWINYYQDHPQEDRMLDDVRLMSLVRNVIEKEQSLFFEFFSEQPWVERNLQLLLKILNTTSADKLKDMNVDFMAKQFHGVSKETKCEFLKFFANLPMRSPEIEKIIFESLTTEEDTALRKEITSALKAWVAKSLSCS